MKRYSISYRYSRDGKVWSRVTVTVTAETDYGAIAQIQSKAPYVEDIKILSVR